MEVILQSQNASSKFGMLDLASRELRRFSNAEKPHKETQGIFRDTEVGVVCFFRSKQGLSIAVEKQLIVFEDNTKIMIQHATEGRKHFSVQRGEDIILSLTYNHPTIDPPLGFYQFFSPVDEEDFDIFLLIHNVFNDLERRNRIFQPKSFYRSI